MRKLHILFALFFLPFALRAQNALPIPPMATGPVINLTMQVDSVNFYGTPTQTMGFNGAFLGPSLMLTKGDSVTINVTNQLGEVTTVHWHGLHVSPENDGGPHSVIDPGATWTKSMKVLDHAATYWYHPHLHMYTNAHVTKGLAGFILVSDADEAALTLPRDYGTDDFPIVVQSRDFDANKQLVHGTALDTALLVNGVRNAYLDVPEQVVRLRLLNGSSERAYNFGFSDGRSFHMIASDGGLLSAPVSMNRLLLAPGERAEVLVDFQGDLGQTVYLMSYASEIGNGIYGASQPGMGMGQTIANYASNPLNGSDFNILQMNVTTATPGAVTSIPGSLVTVTPYAEADADTTRSLLFEPQSMGPTAIEGPFLINGTAFNMNVMNQIIRLGDTEIWELTNQSPISHPFHIHDVQFYILDINGATPPVHQQGRKDVVLVPPMQTVRFITRFEDFASDTMPYMYHCHMLTHEDEGMMHQFLVVDTTITARPEPGADAGIVLYPNPAASGTELRLRGLDGSAGTLRLTDVLGRELWSRELAAGSREQRILLPALPAGNYLLSFPTREGLKSRKLIIRE